MTNGDRIRAMTDEELAKLIAYWIETFCELDAEEGKDDSID